MSVAKKFGISFLFGFLLTAAIFVSSRQTAMAAEHEFKFKIGKTTISDDDYELKTPSAFLYVVSDDGTVPTSVTWKSSMESVISFDTTYVGESVAATRILRKGPGYTYLTASIKADGNDYVISLLVKVDLFVDTVKTGMISVSSTDTGNKFLVLDVDDPTHNSKQIKLKYIDYTEEDGTTVSGGAIDMDDYAFNFQSSNEGVVSVDEDGLITAVGSGYADVTISFQASEEPLYTSMRVVVSPSFSVKFYATDGTEREYASQASDTAPVVRMDFPGIFNLSSNANPASNLSWEVWDVSTDTRKKLSANSDRVKYTVNPTGNTVSFSAVKAGTYEIYAYTNSSYNNTTNAPYAYMKIVVPITMDNLEVYMQKDDTFSIFDNSNIPSATSFNYSLSGGAGNYIRLDTTTGLVTALKTGYAEVKCTPDENSGISFSDGPGYVIIKVHVIDGISLSMTKATMYTSSTLQLIANVSDNSAAVTWTSNNGKVATVDAGGLITALTKGTATITASQKINGTVRKATCVITVQQSVSKIVLVPGTAVLNMGENAVIRAEITPGDLVDVNLTWTSSNENIVSIFESGTKTATVTAGKTSGTAVISAINQQNVVVGYCNVTVKQKIGSISLSETNVSIPLSEKKLQLRASITPTNTTNKEVSWYTSDSSKATVNEDGLVSLKSAGAVTITAVSKDDNTVTATCDINILVGVASISLTEKTKLMYVGESATLVYKVMPANSSSSAVTWTSSNPSVASVSSTGVVAARSVGTTVIMVRTADGGYTAYCTVTVQRKATGIKLAETSIEIKVGETYEMKAALVPADSTNTTITWESTDTKIATVDSSGKITGKSKGSALIVARIPSGATVYCRVTVGQPVNGLILNYTEKIIYIGGEFELKVSVSPSSASKPDVKWSSADTAVATVSELGIVRGISGGTAVITCTTVDGGYSATCLVKVREGKPGVYLDYDSYILGLKEKVTLHATITDGAESSSDVYWTSSDDDIASVNQNGVVTGKKLGRATITAIAEDGSGEEASCEIRVVTLATGVSLNPTSTSILIGQTKQLKATIKNSDATIKTVSWDSSDPDVATVDEDGIIFGAAEGTAIITAETADNSGKKAVCYVTVNKRVPATGITLQDKQAVMTLGEERIVATALTPVTSNDGLVWSTDNTAVAKVDKKSGKITARATGVAYVTAMTDSGKTATVEVIVVGLNFSKLTMEQYSTFTDLRVDGAASDVSWSSDNPYVATVSSNGVVTSKGVGTATITATVNGRKLSCKVKVVKIK